MNNLFEQIPNERTEYLISRDTKGKVRLCVFSYEYIEDEHKFIIHRITGQLGGKRTSQPDKEVLRGKATRNLWQQVELEFNHLVKEKLDKGYKIIQDDPEEYSSEQIDEILGEVITNQGGVPKPMLAKQFEKVTSQKTFDKEYYASRKIDGLRALIYMGEDGELHTSSRGAMNYDSAMVEILTHPSLIEYFENHPGLILDGEVYHHGLSLQKINSIARTQVKATDYSVLQFYLYDIVDLQLPFEERLEKINEFAEALDLTFEPERTFNEGELRIQVVPHEKISGWKNIESLHDKYVAEGWEGVVIRLSDSLYKPNSRTNSWIKVKKYQDKEFKIIGYELGLRGNEDMTFRCITEDGIEFLAKPWGDRELKDWYVENFDEECLNQYAVVKYFYLSDDGTPLQPSVKCVRLKGDM